MTKDVKLKRPSKPNSKGIFFEHNFNPKYPDYGCVFLCVFICENDSTATAAVNRRGGGLNYSRFVQVSSPKM